MTESLTYDIFISHAFEEKEAFVSELAKELTKSGLKVWYSGFDLRRSNSISTGIKNALKKSVLGIILISPVYVQKQWAMNELNTLLSQEKRHSRILPVLHKICISEIKKHFPILAGRYMISSDEAMSTVVSKIQQTIIRLKKEQEKTQIKSQTQAFSLHTDPGRLAVRNFFAANKNKYSTIADSGSNALVLFILIILIVIGMYFFFKASGATDPGI